MNFLLSLGLLVLVTSKEALWFRPLLGNKGFDAVVALLLALFALSLFVSVETGPVRLVVRPRFVFPKRRGVLLFAAVAGVFILFLGFHELAFGDRWRSLKFAVYLVFLTLLLSDNTDLDRIARALVWMGCAIGASLVLQNLLMVSLEANNLGAFPVLPPSAVEGRFDADFYNPFGLGYLRSEQSVRYGTLDFFRQFSYTTESKYCSLLLLVSLACTLLARDLSRRRRRVAIGLLAVGLWLCHAYASFAVLLIAGFIAFVARRFSAATVLGFLLTSTAGFVLLMRRGTLGFSAYTAERIRSFFDTVVLPAKDVDVGAIWKAGVGFGYEKDLSGLVLQFVRYGLPGLLLQLAMMGIFFVACIRAIKRSENAAGRFAVGLAFAIVVAFVGLFASEFITPLFAFLYAVVFRYASANAPAGPATSRPAIA